MFADYAVLCSLGPLPSAAAARQIWRIGFHVLRLFVRLSQALHFSQLSKYVFKYYCTAAGWLAGPSNTIRIA